METNIKSQIYTYINGKYGYGKTFLLQTLYEDLSSIRQGTIREVIRRFINSGKVIKLKAGVYQLPNPNRVLKRTYGITTDAVEILYLKDENNVFGYLSGINFSNKLGLTSQTASIETIYSNRVAKKKREVVVNNLKFIVNYPRYPVSGSNYKVLQILDLLTSYEQFSEYGFEDTIKAISGYLKGYNINPQELEKIVSVYPQKTQTLFYKSGLNNEIARK